MDWVSKVEHAKGLIADTVARHRRVAVACSFGKDSMVTVHLARQVDPSIKVFSIMTRFKPRETLEYLAEMNQKMHLGVAVYMVAESIPPELRNDGVDVRLLPSDEFRRRESVMNVERPAPIYEVDPDECCRLLKVEPTRAAVRELDAWICGLRNTEGRVREDYQEVEEKEGLIKVNPILTFTEADVWRYIATRGIRPHPWYALGYRSLGCAPCSSIGGELERDGRWRGTSKCGGECGIHTRSLR
jgi:phosphoadenosine phosphosulfate reductase